jgi:anti-sigma B factor antagonist
MDTLQLNTQVRNLNGATSVIEIIGDVTAQAEEALTEAFNQVTGQGARNILLDFSQLDYMNSSGIGLLVTLLIRVKRQNQRLYACGLSEYYRQIFELTRLEEAIAIYASQEEALAALN